MSPIQQKLIGINWLKEDTCVASETNKKKEKSKKEQVEERKGWFVWWGGCSTVPM